MTIYPSHDPASQAERMRYPAWCSLLLFTLQKQMLRSLVQLMLLIFSLLAYGQASAACNISFTAAAGGQVTFEAANSQYAGQPARYKYSFSAADSTNCGNADVFGLSNADGSSNSNNTGVTTSAGIMLQSSAKGSNNMFVHSTNNGGPNDFSAFYYSIPAGLSNTTDTFQFYDGNVVLQTATVTIPAATPGAPTGVTATAGNAQASVAFTAPASDGGSAILDYTVTSSPGGFTATGAASPLNVTGLTNGQAYTFTVTARNANGSGTASSASTAVTPKATQTITFNPPGAQTFGTTPTLTATASSGLTPTFTSTTTGVCTITSGGALTFVTAGSCTINADQAGNAAFSAAATVPQTFTVNAIAPGAPTAAAGTAGDTQVSVAFTAPASNGGSAILDYTVTASPGGATATGAASPLNVTGLLNGTAYTFTVTARNSAGSGSASTASSAVTPKAPQTITFNPPGAQTFGTTPTLTATASSGLTPTFTSTTTGVCTITSGGALTFVTAGSCTINADQAGNAAFSAAATVPQTFTVNAIVPGAPTAAVGTPGDTQVSVAFTAPASNGGSAILDYTVTASPGGATATGAASPLNVTGLLNGTAYTFTVTARNSAGSGSASTASSAVTPKAAQTITFNPPGAQTFGTTPTLTATASSTLAVSFTSTTTGVCTVTSGGALTFVTAGSCTINADQAGNGTYLAATTVGRTFAVNATVPGAPTGAVGTAGGGQVSVAFTAPAYNGGSAVTGYTVTASPGGANVSGATSPLVVTGLTNGTPYTFTVTATNLAGTGTASTASTAVTPKAAQTITFNPPGGQAFGTTPTLSATASSGLIPTFTSSTTGVCTITSGGALTFVTTGTCIINADQAGDGTYGVATTISRTFAVNPVVPGAPTGAVGTAGAAQVSVAFTAPVFNGGSAITGYTVTASPGGASVSGATSPLVVTGLTNGTPYTFTVTATNLAGTGAASTASTAVTPKAPQTITFGNPGTQTLGTALTLTASASSGLTVTFTSSTPGVCSVTPGGVVSSISAGVCTINVNQAGNTNFAAAATATQSFTISPLPVGVLTFAKPGAALVTMGSSFTNVATSTLSGGGFGAISYSSSNNAVATVNAAGVVTPVSPGSSTITATQAAVPGVNDQATQTYTLTVAPLPVGILSFTTPNAATVVMGGTLTNPATSTLTGGSYGAISYSSSNTAVATVSANGAITTVSAGTSTITATQAAVAGVNAQATQTYVLTVGKNAQATLRVVSDKSSIFKVTGTATLTTTGGSGTGAISTAVTTGTCSVAGNVVTAGSVAETCVVTVTKAADANYSAATATVSIQILSMATSSVTLASSSLNPMLGQSVNLTATVNPGAATGTASFMDGTTLIAKVNLSAGAASLTTSTLAVGSHNLTVVYSGDANLASSTSGAIVVNVNARPDPVSNPLVKQNIVSQATTTQRFTVAQMSNIYNHVQILHSDFNIRNRFGAGLNVPYLDTLRLVGGKILDNFSGTQEKDVLAGEFGTVKTAENQRRARAPFAQDGTAHQKEKRIAKDEEADQEPVISDDVPRIAGMPAGFWTAGNIDVGSLDAQDGSRTKFSSAGLTLGMDVMVNSKLIAGGSLGYAKDNATFDNLGSESKAKQWSGSLYATYKPEKHWFVDGVLGAGHVTYDNRRWDSNNNVLLSGDRKGKIIYGSMSLTRELILQQFRVHPFGRVDVINVKLDSYSEQGSPMALTFKDSSFTNSTVTGGVDIFKDYFFASGQVTPSLKLQLSHRTSGDINQSVYYSDTGVNGPTYNAIVTGIPEDVQSLGLGLNFKNRRGFQANFAWLGSMGANAYRANSFRLDLRFGF
ncbi:fibronectin type III domain-containing protein [Undibacterium sp. FT79W]|uniref:fibronectin type III domain-containing protein n=1 Tax=Undibacterium sp. FT79W TaxID=2762296 RepID=UPI00164BE50A|nr:fibronectin type III domain-containing protein [Undibacterium sp. FT79W]MBC3877554.1 fibronectin type III domain-containing protein [Undibacterium sp. FT79W]